MKQTTQSVVSDQASITQSMVSQVEVKLRTNQTKAKLRSLFRNIDQEKSGLIKKEAFFTILKLHGIKLEDAELNRLTKNYTRGG